MMVYIPAQMRFLRHYVILIFQHLLQTLANLLHMLDSLVSLLGRLRPQILQSLTIILFPEIPIPEGILTT